MAKSKIEVASNKKEKRVRISQSDIPAYGLSEALRVPRVIIENYAGDPTKPLDVAAAMGLSPTSSTFKMLTGAAIAYGLSEGGYNASSISVTSLSGRIVTPLEDGDDDIAAMEALLKPKIVGEFLRKYDSKQIPKDEIAVNVVSAMGVPRGRAKDVFEMIISEAEKLSLITDIKGKKYVNLGATPVRLSSDDALSEVHAEQVDIPEEVTGVLATNTRVEKEPAVSSAASKRVFITHGKNKEFVEPIKKLLVFGELEAVVSVESQSVSQPVPEKVMADMRSCSAAIIHVAAEMVLMDKEANEHAMLNPNVLIEIGAAMALYGKRFILLVKEGVKMPSNLQGLYEVRYSSEKLDGDATIRLMEAINALKAYPIP